MRRRVKITGLGPVTPAGIGREAFFLGINERLSRVKELDRLEAQAGRLVAAEVENFRVRDWVPDSGRSKRLPRHTEFALAATALALRDAGLSPPDVARLDPVVINGSSLMDMNLLQRSFGAISAKGARHAIPSVIYETPVSAIGGHIAEMIPARCRTLALQSACCGGLDAVGHGARMVAEGETDFAICCGTESPICATPMAEFALVGLSPRNTAKPTEMGRPFDLWRNTGVIGEGACVVLMEPEESPRPAYAWFGGYAFGGDSDGVPASGLAWTMKMSLANAARRAEEVDLIHAWGSGHPDLDRIEALCLRGLFGERLPRIPAVSIKGAIGNPLAAAGAMQVASAALALKTGVVPPTVNWDTPDPECPLNLGRASREVGCELALVNAHGVGGTNASLVLSRR